MPVFDAHVRLAPPPTAVERLLHTLDAHGIERAAVAAGGILGLVQLSRQLVDGSHVTGDADNDAVLRAALNAPDRLTPVYFANPHAPARRYRERAAEFAGMEISPAVHGVPLSDGRTAELVAVAAEHGHSVYTVCITRPGCEVADLVALAERFPAVTFLLGHSGIGNIDFHAVELVRPLPNILMETSGGYTTVVRAAVDRLGADRVLFGSEHPVQHPRVELAKFEVLDLPADQWRRISWDNAVALYDSPQREGVPRDRHDHPAPATR
ncbi:amidohydrolase family protein [Kutzneria sp. NPDC051319]|uniref:amidohydrolase family protein n=1 Tax=Kutzneria sp. NPDC051319 TaxID=3155047 RepID=UPI00343FB0F5